MIVIPGKNRSRAVIMADHYDTAYMEDVYGYSDKGGGPRTRRRRGRRQPLRHRRHDAGRPDLPRAGQAGQLDTDIWLVHLTGEEFPSDCMGARALCQRVVEGSLKIRLADGRSKT